MGMAAGAPGEPLTDPALIRCKPGSARWVLAASVIASSIGFIDQSVVNLALPVIQTQLNAPLSALQWIVEAYVLPLSALMLLGGALGDRLGRRRMFACGIVLFALASIACGLAYDPASLIAARAVQGLGAALMIPGSLSMLSAVFTGKARGAAIGAWSALTAVTTSIGPPVGGWLVDAAGWRWIFFINIPFAVLALVILYRHAPEIRPSQPGQRLDWPGGVLIALALGGIVYGLTTAGSAGLGNSTALVAIAAGVLLLAIFIWTERLVANPMVPLSIFADRTFSGITAVTLLLYGALSGGLFYLPFNLIQLQGYDVLDAAAALLPFAILIASISRFSGALAGRTGGRAILTAGSLVVAAAFYWMGDIGRDADYWRDIGPPLLLLGIGMGFCAAPISTVAMSALPDSQSGLASGINNAVARIATLLAIAGLGLVLAIEFGGQLDRASGTWSPEAVDLLAHARLSLLDVSMPDSLSLAETARLTDLLYSAYETGFSTLMHVAAVLALLSGLIAWTSLKRKPATAAAVPTQMT